MMRYQRVSPDVLPLGSGRKPILRTWKEDDADHSGRSATHSPLESKSIRARSVLGPVDPPPTRVHQFTRISFPSDSPASAVHSESQPPPAAVLQWGHNKRSRGPRAESRSLGDETSAHLRQLLKVPRRSAAAMMPPPASGGSYARGANPRTSTAVRDAYRCVEERSGGPTRPEKRSPPSPPDKPPRAAADGPMNPPDQEAAAAASPVVAIGEKLSLDQFEWPKIYISLSRKEKEDDFLAMKGTKLPQRPKKRAKNIDNTLQYCFPGMWLSDLTRGRYEVREKKCAKKRRRGLKGMEGMDSDSE